MDHRWVARGLVLGLHLALLAALWLHRAPALNAPGERRVTTIRLLQPRPDRPQPPAAPPLAAPRLRTPDLPAISPLQPTADLPAPSNATTPTAPQTAPPTVATPAEPPRTTLRLTLPPGYAASSAAARNPALSDPRSNSPRPTFEDRIADATGGAGAWVEETTSDNRSQSVGAQGDHRTVMRRGNTCVEVFRSRIADMDAFNGNVAPRSVSMLGKSYKCK